MGCGAAISAANAMAAAAPTLTATGPVRCELVTASTSSATNQAPANSRSIARGVTRGHNEGLLRSADGTAVPGCATAADNGNRARTTNPPCVVKPVRISPPCIATRSRMPTNP